VEIFRSARRHGIADEDIVHAVEQALVAGEQEDSKVLYLGADRAGNLLEVVSVVRDDGSEVVGEGGSDAGTKDSWPVEGRRGADRRGS
jgi:hypothetical protein